MLKMIKIVMLEIDPRYFPLFGKTQSVSMKGLI